MAQLTVLRSCDVQKSSYGKSIEIDYATGNFLPLLQSGRTAQKVATQGKNLLDLTKLNIADNQAVVNAIGANKLSITDNRATLPPSSLRSYWLKNLAVGSTYTVSASVSGNGVAPPSVISVDEFDSSNARTLINVKTFTVKSGYTYKIKFYTSYSATGTVSISGPVTMVYDNIQLELGSTATAYAPFVPNSPSPDYPSPITGVTKTTVNSVDYAIPQTLYDGDSYDYVSGTGVAVKKVITLDGSADEPITFGTHTNGQQYIAVTLTQPADATAKPISDYYASSAWTQTNGKIYTTTGAGIVITDSRFTNLSVAKSILAARPVTVLYQLATPTAITGTPQSIPTALHNTITNDGGGQISATYNVSLEPVAKTSRAFLASSTKELMRAYIMTATLLNTDAARQYITTGAVLKVGGQLYDLSGYKQNSGTNNVTQIDGRHVGYRLNKYSVPVQYSFVGTAREIVQDMLDHCLDAYGRPASAEFSIGTAADVGTQSFSLGNDQPITLREAILSIQAIGVEVDFDNFTLNFPLKCGTGNTKTFKFGRDLCDLNRTWDVDNGMTYDVAIANLQRIPGHVGDVFGVGDEVVIEDDFIGDAVSRRIISYTKSFDDPSKDAITLGVFVRTFADVTTAMKIDINGAQSTAEGAQNAADAAQQTANAANELAESSVQVGTSYNGVDVSHEFGFRSVSADGKYRKFDNGTDGYVVQQLYNGAWVTVWQTQTQTGKTIAYNLSHTQKVEMGGDTGLSCYVSGDGGATWKLVAQLKSSGLDAGKLRTIGSKIFGTVGEFSTGSGLALFGDDFYSESGGIANNPAFSVNLASDGNPNSGFYIYNGEKEIITVVPEQTSLHWADGPLWNQNKSTDIVLRQDHIDLKINDTIVQSW